MKKSGFALGLLLLTYVSLSAWERQLLVIGGFNGSRYYADVRSLHLSGPTAERETGWRTQAPLPQALQGHAAVLLKDRVCVIGGFTGFSHDRRPLFSAEVLTGKIAAGRIDAWTRVGMLPRPLAYHAVVTYRDYIISSGGQSPADVAAVYLCSVSDSGEPGCWKRVADLPRAMRGHAAVMVDDRLFILGGHDDRALYGDVISAPVASDGTIGPWQSATPLPRPLIHFGVAAYNGRIYISGGQDENWRLRRELYSVQADGAILGTWRQERSFGLAQARMGLNLDGQRLIVSGGGYGWDEPVYNSVLAAVVAADGRLGKWRKIARLPKALAFHAALIVPGTDDRMQP